MPLRGGKCFKGFFNLNKMENLKATEKILFDFYNFCMDEKDGDLREYYIFDYIECKKQELKEKSK